METVSQSRGEPAIADAYLARCRQGDNRKIAFDGAVAEFQMRYPAIPRDLAAELVRFLIAAKADESE